jgi:hypothetical protein
VFGLRERGIVWMNWMRVMDASVCVW